MESIVILGALLELASGFVYIKEILAGKAKPNRVTFLLWGIAPLIAAVASFSEGVYWASLPVFVTALMPLLIFFTSFLDKKAYWRLQKFDYLCGGFSLVALFLWWYTKDANLAIIFAIISDFFASMPTLQKIRRYPETEARFAYLLTLFNSGSAFFVLRLFNFSELAFPVYLFTINLIMVIMLYLKEIKNFLKIK